MLSSGSGRTIKTILNEDFIKTKLNEDFTREIQRYASFSSKLQISDIHDPNSLFQKGFNSMNSNLNLSTQPSFWNLGKILGQRLKKPNQEPSI